MGEMERQPELRIGDAERHRVAEFLREAAGQGRLEVDELDERLEATYRARTYADLVPITADLALPDQAPIAPATSPTSQVVPPGGVEPVETSLALLSGVNRRGVWQIGQTHTATAILGGVDLDLREAQFAAREIVITANAVLGGVEITVNAHTHVVMEGSGILGGFEQARDRVPAELSADSPVVRVRGFALLGGVTVTRKRMPGEPRRRKLP
ncbi:DUF1707 SHOCT-like domain-containing protein [Nocardioides insulae]|uniref:DUF1707 SHOCT-like domain-containing protein n=1 Tax=Nocardioides insulae TaxID=394734 RepID=UPI00056B7D98|nr:DUF1707 domain-containing protein [Nocardioides insulae]